MSVYYWTCLAPCVCAETISWLWKQEVWQFIAVGFSLPQYGVGAWCGGIVSPLIGRPHLHIV